MNLKVIACTGLAALALPVAVQAAEQPTGQDRQNAARECRALRAAMGRENFANQYGTNRNKSNAYGKCVSSKAREEARERQQARSNAARDCRAERADQNFPAAHEGKTFEQFYGTGNGKNAFGRCVSQKARANKAEADQADQERINAARACRAEQRQDPDAFRQAYGSRRNAFGKCVSRKARAQHEQEQQPS
jgi:hypothetical protein